MSPERWKRAKELFSAAAELHGTEREAFLVSWSENDSELAAEVRRLLEFHDQSQAAIDRPPVAPSLLPGAFQQAQVFTAGEVVGQRFRILRLLGEGGMGQVFEAEDMQLGARVAIKTLKPNLIENEKVEARFRQEVHLARQVSHPNVCRVFDFGQRDGVPPVLYFSMELLEGESLARRLERMGRLPFEDAAPLIRQMCAALAAAHAAGVVHRDFKASNIFLVPAQQQAGVSERLVVTDFGLSRHYAERSMAAAAGTTSAGTALGTPAYMAPEQIEARKAGPTADIYALGVVMYEMATGSQPFTGPTPLAVMARKLKDEAPAPSKCVPGVDRRWDAVILQCLAREPEDRFQSAAEVAAALGLDTGSSAWSGSRQAVKWRGPRRRKVQRWALMVAAASLAGVAGWWGLLRPRGHEPTPAAARWYAQGVESLAGNASVTASRLLEQAVEADPEFALARARLADAYTELDIPGKAKDELLRVTGLVGDGSRQPKLDRLRIEAARHTVTRDYPKAVAALEEIQRSVPAGAERVTASLELARALERAGRRKEAIAALREAIALDPQNPAAQLHLGILSYRSGQPEVSQTALREAERLFELRGLDEGVSEALLQRSYALERARRFEQAGAAALRVRERARTLKHPWHLARASFQLASLASERGDLPAARQLIAEGIAVAGEERMPGIVARGLIDLGFTLITQSRLKEAEEISRESIAIASRAGNEMAETDGTIQLAQTLIRARRLEDGMAALAPALASLRKNPAPSLSAALAIQVNGLIALGRTDEALAGAEELLTSARSRGDGESVLRARERIDHVRGVRGEFPAVVESEKLRLSEYQAQGQQVRIVGTLTSLGHREAILGRAADSERHFAEAEERALSLKDAGTYSRFRLLSVRASLAELAGNPAKAAGLTSQALALGKQLKGTPMTVLEVTAAYAQCALGAAPEPLQKLAQSAQQKKETDGTLAAEIALAKCYARRNRWSEAITPARRALELSAEAGDPVKGVQASWLLAKAAGKLKKAGEAAQLSEEAARKLEEFTKTWEPLEKKAFLSHPEHLLLH